MEQSPGQITCSAKQNKFKKTEILSSIFPNHNGEKPEIDQKKEAGKSTSIRRLNTVLLSNHWAIKEIKRRNEKIPRDR